MKFNKCEIICKCKNNGLFKECEYYVTNGKDDDCVYFLSVNEECLNEEAICDAAHYLITELEEQYYEENGEEMP